MMVVKNKKVILKMEKEKEYGSLGIKMESKQKKALSLSSEAPLFKMVNGSIGTKKEKKLRFAIMKEAFRNSIF